MKPLLFALLLAPIAVFAQRDSLDDIKRQMERNESARQEDEARRRNAEAMRRQEEMARRSRERREDAEQLKKSETARELSAKTAEDARAFRDVAAVKEKTLAANLKYLTAEQQVRPLTKEEGWYLVKLLRLAARPPADPDVALGLAAEAEKARILELSWLLPHEAAIRAIYNREVAAQKKEKAGKPANQ